MSFSKVWQITFSCLIGIWLSACHQEPREIYSTEFSDFFYQGKDIHDGHVIELRNSYLVKGGPPVGVDKKNRPVIWKQLPVVFSFDPDFPQDIREPCVRAGKTLNSAIGFSMIEFLSDDHKFSSPRSTNDMVQAYQKGEKNFNVISFGKWDIKYHDLPGELARTFTEFIGTDNLTQIIHSDIDFDARKSGDVESVCLHEFGHALGLDHSQEPSSFMNEKLTGVRRSLTENDVATLQVLYGPARCGDKGTSAECSAKGEHSSEGALIGNRNEPL